MRARGRSLNKAVKSYESVIAEAKSLNTGKDHFYSEEHRREMVECIRRIIEHEKNAAGSLESAAAAIRAVR